MFALIYLATLVFFGSVGLWAHSMYEQRIGDAQTIARLRRKVRDLDKQVEDLESQITMLKVF